MHSKSLWHVSSRVCSLSRRGESESLVAAGVVRPGPGAAWRTKLEKKKPPRDNGCGKQAPWFVPGLQQAASRLPSLTLAAISRGGITLGGNTTAALTVPTFCESTHKFERGSLTIALCVLLLCLLSVRPAGDRVRTRKPGPDRRDRFQRRRPLAAILATWLSLSWASTPAQVTIQSYLRPERLIVEYWAAFRLSSI